MTGEIVKNSRAEGPCADYEWLVGPYLDGELPDGEEDRLEEHLERCQDCTTLADQFRNLDDLARDVLGKAPRVSAQEWGGMWEAIQQGGHVDARPGRRLFDWIVPALSLAALLVFGLWLGYYVFQGAAPDEKGPDTAKQPEPEVIPTIIDDPEATIIDFESSG